MQDEHFYTRALELDPKNSFEYYLGRAKWYCTEHEYEKACADLCKIKELINHNLSYRKRFDEESYYFEICQEFIESEKNIELLTKEIEEKPDEYSAYLSRARLYLLQRKYSDAINDAMRALKISNTIDTYIFLHDLFSQIKEFNVFDIVNKSKGADLVNALRYRVKYAEEKILLKDNYEYWQKRAEIDMAKIAELLEDKTLALYYKVVFYEQISNFGNAIMYCEKVIEQSQNHTDKLGEALTYLYKEKLAKLNWESSNISYEEYEKIKNNLKHPSDAYITKGLNYINEFYYYFNDILKNYNWWEQHKECENE